MVPFLARDGFVAACATAVLPCNAVVAVAGAVRTAAQGHRNRLNLCVHPCGGFIVRRRAHAMVCAFARLPIATCAAAVLIWMPVVAFTGASVAAALTNVGIVAVTSDYWGGERVGHSNWRWHDEDWGSDWRREVPIVEVGVWRRRLDEDVPVHSDALP